MASLNKVCLIGRVGAYPEIRSMNNGKEVANISLATSENWKDKQTGEKKERTEWHKITVFNEGLVKVIKQYVNKGDQLYIEGQLQTRKWQDNDGKDRYTTEIVLQGYGGSLIMLGSGSGGGSKNTSSASEAMEYAGMSKKTEKYDPKVEGLEELDDENPF